jgi:hypothetical protein
MSRDFRFMRRERRRIYTHVRDRVNKNQLKNNFHNLARDAIILECESSSDYEKFKRNVNWTKSYAQLGLIKSVVLGKKWPHFRNFSISTALRGQITSSITELSR